MKRFMALVILVTPVWLARRPEPGSHFQIVRSSRAAAARFGQEIAGCAAGTRAFAAIVASIPESEPVRTVAADSLRGVLFGASSDPETSEPLFMVNLSELATLPVAAAVRQWQPDSSWALTRCEVLVHELAETLAYRALWRARPATETAEETEALFGVRKRRAHLAGLAAERSVAREQRTRRDAAGEGYGRTRECFATSAVHVILGPHTETLVIGGPSSHQRIVYYPNQDLCAGM